MSSVSEARPRYHKLTVSDYYRMAEVGILAPDARVELIEGEIIDMVPIGSAHASCVDRLLRILAGSVGDQAIVRVQNPLRLGGLSEPEPDLMLLKPRKDFYASRHPGADDVLLLIEVSDTSLQYDLDVKFHSMPPTASPRSGWSTWKVNGCSSTASRPARRIARLMLRRHWAESPRPPCPNSVWT